MKSYNYFSADSAVAAKLAGAPDTIVWYYRPKSKTPDVATIGAAPPADIALAIVASAAKELVSAAFLAGPTKDPIPPPPPPPDEWSTATTFLSHPAVQSFFLTIGREAVTDEPLDAHALVVQIAGYPAMPLPAVDDADDLAAVLRDPSLCGYAKGRVRVLKDAQANKNDLTKAIEDLIAAAGPESTVLFYFSGHGGQVDGQTYVVPYDASRADLAGTSISAEALRTMFRRCAAKRVLLVFDCCHADGLEAKDVLPFEPSLSAQAHDTLGEWVVFAACRAGERSYVRRGERNGVFTTHFLSGLREGALDGDDFVGPMGLFRHLAPRVTQAESRQHPVFNCKLEKDFTVARYQGGRKATVPKADDTFEYHALLSFAEADTDFVARELLPRLTTAGLKIATASEDLVAGGMDRVLGLERGLELARRTVVVLSPAYLQHKTAADRYTDFALLQRANQDIESGKYTVLPVYIENPERLEQPLWLRSLVGLRLGAALRPLDSADRQIDRLIDALRKPVPRKKPI